MAEGLVGRMNAPQGTALSPFLFLLCTSDFQCNSETCHLQKLSDDLAVVGCIRGEYRRLVDHFVERCGAKHLMLNVTKMRVMVVDFRRNGTLEENHLSGGGGAGGGRLCVCMCTCLLVLSVSVVINVLMF